MVIVAPLLLAVAVHVSTREAPPVGWMTWYAVKFDASERTILENARAFGLVPQDRADGVVEFLEKKGLVCSVYFAQYLLEALCEAGRIDTRSSADRMERTDAGCSGGTASI